MAVSAAACRQLPACPLPFCSPQGYYCVGGSAKTACDANEFNRFLGAKTDTCVTCTTGAPRQTSYAGSAYCTIPYVETECGEQQFKQQTSVHVLPLGAESQDAA